MMNWKQAIERWRELSPQERRLRHLRAIPRHVANSMAMEGQLVSEEYVREVLARSYPELADGDWESP